MQEEWFSRPLRDSGCFAIQPSIGFGAKIPRRTMLGYFQYGSVKLSMNLFD
jgi:hypothetical protein